MGSIRRTASGRYEARYRDPHGRQRGKTFRRRSDAARFLAAVETDKQRGVWKDPRSGRVRFADFAAGWLETTVHLKPSTRVSYEMLLRRHVLPYFGPLHLSSIERMQVQSWLSDLMLNGIRPGTVRNAFHVFSRRGGGGCKNARLQSGERHSPPAFTKTRNAFPYASRDQPPIKGDISSLPRVDIDGWHHRATLG